MSKVSSDIVMDQNDMRIVIQDMEQVSIQYVSIVTTINTPFGHGRIPFVDGLSKLGFTKSYGGLKIKKVVWEYSCLKAFIAMLYTHLTDIISS